jgi:nitrogen fixation/metabolism regulation signal transduction histidine kinase
LPAAGSQAEAGETLPPASDSTGRGRLTLRLALIVLPAPVVAAGTTALAAASGATPWLALAVGLVAGVALALLALARFVRPLDRVLGALEDGVAGWRSGDFSLRLAPSVRPEAARLVTLYNAVGDALRRERNELRQRELLLATVIELSPAAVLLVNAADRVLLANRQARRMFGDGSELSGHALTEILAGSPEAVAQAVCGQGDALVSTGEAGSEEVFHVNVRRLELNARAHRLILVQRLTAELRRQEVAAWKKLIRVVAHELNNSLAPIRSLVHSARLIRRSGRGEERLDEVLDTIDDSAARLHRFIDGYARFARLPTPRREAIDVATFLVELERLEPFAVVGSFPTRALHADPAQLQQALLNLLKNAREAGSPPGETTIAVRDLGAAGFELAIADRGSGMDEATMAQALLPFYSSKPEGTGLGLALAREIVEAHGGSLQLANRPDGGLVVRCLLPAA